MFLSRALRRCKITGRYRAPVPVVLAFYASLNVLAYWMFGSYRGYDPVATMAVTNSRMFEQYIQLSNDMGLPVRNWHMYEDLVKSDEDLEQDEFNIYIQDREAHEKIDKNLRLTRRHPEGQPWALRSRRFFKEMFKTWTLREKVEINLAVVACGTRKDEALNMIKSAVLFSQDAHLHLIVFSDKKTILKVAAKIMELRWTAQALGFDFTYELHLDWFPKDGAWKDMWAPCSTQRLFLPSLLPHIDSLMYLDSDILILSNLTKLWTHFKNNMGSSKMAAMTPNSETTAPGYYEGYRHLSFYGDGAYHPFINLTAVPKSKTPFYGKRGLNAGVMLINLTQMREFGLEEKSEKIYTNYKKDIVLADQDILNTLFHDYPDKLHVLNCSYNFYWVHCNHPHYNCSDNLGNSICFCRSVHDDGVQIVHGNMDSFHNQKMPFLKELYQEFEKFDMILTDHHEFFSSLQEKFRLHERPCGPLTAELMYNNAMTYLKNLCQ